MARTPRKWPSAALACLLLWAAGDAFGLGSDYPAGQPVNGPTNWPAGMSTLINTSNRVWGFFVNAHDVFFFAGGASQLTTFLRDYSLLEGVERHRVVLHDGIGDAKSPWEKASRSCDWKLYVCPKGWHNIGVLSKQGSNSVEVLRKAANEPGYVAEVHFWTGGRIKLDQVDIPKNVAVEHER